MYKYQKIDNLKIKYSLVQKYSFVVDISKLYRGLKISGCATGEKWMRMMDHHLSPRKQERGEGENAKFVIERNIYMWPRYMWVPPSVTPTGFTNNRYNNPKLTVEYYNWFIALTIHTSDLSARGPVPSPFRDASRNRSNGTAIDDRPHPVDSPLLAGAFIWHGSFADMQRARRPR